jgi:transcriptional/translational regulatory protein YebC/TACO1
MFNRRGVFVIEKESLKIDVEDLELIAIEAGAEDIKDEEESIEIICLPENFDDVRLALEENKIETVEVDISMIPENTVDISDLEMAQKVMRLVDMLEDHDDVQEVYGNFLHP